MAFIALSILMFFFSAQVSLTIYIDSSYLKHVIEQTPSLMSMKIWDEPENAVGGIYAIGSLITLLALLYAPRVMKRAGNYRWTLTVLILHVLILIGLALFNTGLLIIPLFVVEAAIISVLYFNLDIFLERYSKDSETGTIRGLFLMIGSIAWCLPPLLAGNIIDNSGFSLVYLSGAALMIPAIFILIRYFSDFQDLAYDDTSLFFSRELAKKYPDVGRILASNYLMHFFYSWMIIYTPLYLHNHLGFSYSEIGLLLSVVLTAFIIFPYPAGWIADKLLGEKELLVFGFLSMAVTTAMIPTLGSSEASFFLWAVVLFLGRMGASTVETMNETYFFKQIDGHNAGLMGYFRRSRPLAFLSAPLLASLLLGFEIVPIQGLFYVLAAIMCVAIYFPLRLKDTK
jgi:MFS family permease